MKILSLTLLSFLTIFSSSYAMDKDDDNSVPTTPPKKGVKIEVESEVKVTTPANIIGGEGKLKVKIEKPEKPCTIL